MTLKNIWSFVRKPYVIFILSALLFGTIFIKITPPLWGLDEPSHVGRVLHILKGQFASNGDQNNPANFVPDNLSELTRYRIDDILDVVRMDNIIGRKDVTDVSVYGMLTARPLDKSEHFSTYIANYSPVAYPGPIVGAGIAQLLNLNMGQTLTLMRFMSLVSYIVLAALAIWIVRAYKVRWLFLIAAMIPTAVFQASVVTADTMLLGISLLFLALVYRVALEEGVHKSLLIALAIVSVLMPLIKANHAVLILILIGLPAVRFGSKRASIIYKVGLVAGGMCLALAWAQLTRLPAASTTFSQRADQVIITPSEQVSRTLRNPLRFGKAVVKSLVVFGDAYYQGMFFTVSGNSVATPLIITASLSGAILLAAFMAKEELLKVKKLLIWGGLVSVIYIALVFGALYVGFTPVNWPVVDGVQGRYFLPLVVPISMLIATFIPVDLKAKSRSLRIIILATALISLLASAVFVFMAYY